MAAAPESETKSTDGGETSYKEKLDQLAEEARSATDRAKPSANPILDKVAQHIPGLSHLTGTEEPNEPSEETIPGPPHRPHHDNQIEEFVRHEHRSKKEDGKLE